MYVHKLYILLPRLVSHDGSEDRKGGYRSTLTPSDTSIDDSVKSGKVGKDVLLMYLNKTKPSRYLLAMLSRTFIPLIYGLTAPEQLLSTLACLFNVAARYVHSESSLASFSQ